MPHLTKIATCCYCGTRAALVLKGRERHELACSGCGAPLHDLKAMPLTPERPRKAHADRAVHAPRPRPVPEKHAHTKYRKKPKKSKRKSGLRYLAYEAFDFLEDIFD